MTAREQWGGGEWEEHCCRLLGIRYGENIQRVPDRVRGDGGLEAYRLDCGTVYQCFAPKDPFNVQAQTAAQKRKIQDDIRTLVSKPQETVAILGEGYLVNRWVLLTPEYDDKELIKYARLKSRSTRSPIRPVWCAEDFEIVVSSDMYLFSAEMARLGDSTHVIRLNVPPITEDDAYASVEDGVAARLTEKLRKSPALRADDAELRGYRSETLLDYVHGQKQLAILEDKYTAAYAAVSRRALSTHRRLTKRLAGGTGGLADLTTLAHELSAQFATDVPELASIACEELAHYYIAAWWVSCTLRFRAAG
jgi:hypothetical protein